jgi:hypothetical protein
MLHGLRARLWRRHPEVGTAKGVAAPTYVPRFAALFGEKDADAASTSSTDFRPRRQDLKVNAYAERLENESRDLK